MGRSVLLYNSSTILTMPLLRPYAAFSSQLQLDPFPQHVRDLLRATVMEREIRREKPPKIQDHHRPVKARELELDLPRAVAHQRKLRHSQEDQEARRQRKLDPAQQAARLERAENKEFEQGHDRAPPAAEDKVDKKFWQGKGGSADHE